MKTLYIDCGMGAAGDMLTAALLELVPEPEKFLSRFRQLGLSGVELTWEKVSKCGIMGSHVSVLVHGEEEHSEDAVRENGGQEHLHGHDSRQEHPYEHLPEYNCGHEHGQASEHEHGDERVCEHEHRHAREHRHGYANESVHKHTHEHVHTDMQHIRKLIGSLDLPGQVKKDVEAVYGLIAAAESSVHGVPVEQIHFHEVGAMDAVADVTAVCLLMSQLAPEQVVVSPVNVGSGHVHCAHGILPVPAPATLRLLKQVPIYSSSVKGELCTPTGAALLSHFATGFGPIPLMRVKRAGYGMGSKDFEIANCVRVLLGESVG